MNINGENNQQSTNDVFCYKFPGFARNCVISLSIVNLIVKLNLMAKGKAATLDSLRQNSGLPAKALETVDVLGER
jgi:hypothetical protein